MQKRIRAGSGDKSRKKPSEYERKAIHAIHAWKNPQIGWFGKAWETINWPLSKASTAIEKMPGFKWAKAKGKAPIEWVLQKTVGGLVTLLNDAAQWSVRPKAIYSDFAKSGIDVKSRSDIFDLDLEQIDRALGWLDVKYKSIAAAEGGTTGAAGLPGIPVDIVAIVGINLRAIGEYATYCGFDVSAQSERLFAMNVLALASSPTDSAKQAALAQLVRIAKDVAAKKAWKKLEEHSFVNIVKKIAAALGQRLTKAKLAQVIPYLGAGVGVGFNTYFTAKVCEAAFFLYRERFLAEKYGPDIIEQTVKAAESFSFSDDTDEA
jgi:hypothetical protein